MSLRPVRNLLRIAAHVSKTDPILGYELERCALSVINPGARKFEDHVKDTVEILENLKAELEKADSQLDTDDAAEFAKFFDDEAAAQEEELRQMLKVSSYIRRMAEDDTAGVMDKVKGLFKKKKKEEPEPDASPSYMMDDESMNDFVEGKKDWADPGTHVEKESKENKEFFEDADNIVKLLDRVRDKPSRNMVRSILQDIGEVIAKGKAIMKGVYEKTKSVKVDEGGAEEPKKPAAKKGVPNLDGTIEHYMDMLKESAGDEKKVLKYLKEFFNTVKPALEEDRASLAAKRAKILPLLVRTASANPGTRPVLLPVIRRWTGR